MREVWQWQRRSPATSGASIDRIEGGGIKKTRSCDLNVSASTLVPCESVVRPSGPARSVRSTLDAEPNQSGGKEGILLNAWAG